MRNGLVWVLILFAGIALIVLGFQGRLGSAIAALVTPAQLIDVK